MTEQVMAVCPCPHFHHGKATTQSNDFNGKVESTRLKTIHKLEGTYRKKTNLRTQSSNRTEVDRLALFAQNDPLSTTAQLERSASRGSSISHS